MWPPSSEDSLFARRMIATAFQRIADRILCSRSRFQVGFASCWGGIVLTYGVVALKNAAPPRLASSATRSSRYSARSGPRYCSTALIESTHSPVSTGSTSDLISMGCLLGWRKRRAIFAHDRADRGLRVYYPRARQHRYFACARILARSTVISLAVASPNSLLNLSTTSFNLSQSFACSNAENSVTCIPFFFNSPSALSPYSRIVFRSKRVASRAASWMAFCSAGTSESQVFFESSNTQTL